MSIFKYTFKRYVLKQILARQDLLKTEGKRPIEFQQYVSAKSPWVKMTSFVDYDKNYDLEDANYYSKAKYSDELAKKNILYGGTALSKVANNGSILNKQRYGIIGSSNVGENAAYGSNQWKMENNQYGLVPMPGIHKVQVDTVNAYGSLRQATITFYAWNLKQLEDLEILYMRPFYPILLEWGWSLYLDTYDQQDLNKNNIHDIQNISKSDVKIKNDFVTINPFDTRLDQEKIYELLEEKRKKYSGNYDGLLGFVKNFNRKLLANGGYECTVTLISLGEIIPSLKSNYATGTHAKGEEKDTDREVDTRKKQSEPKKDHFETLLTLLMSGEKSKSNDIQKIDKQILESKYKNKVDLNIYEIGEPKNTKKDPTKMTFVNNYYIQLGYFLYIINYESNLYEKNFKKHIEIELPFSDIKDNVGNGLCLAGKNTISIDPLSCIIRNTFTEIFTSKDENKKKLGYSYDTFVKNATNSSVYKEINMFVKTYSVENNKMLYHGEIGNIYVSLNRIADNYKLEINNQTVVSWDKIIRDILSFSSFALGSINDFDVYSENNKYIIFDKFYIEDPAESKLQKKAEINIIGTNTTVRTHNIETRIFQSQAYMFAIAAQDRYNISSIETSTVAYLNKGLKSRILSERRTKDNLNIENEQNERDKIFGSELLEIENIVKEYFLDGEIPTDYATNIMPTINSFLNSILLQVDGAANFKAIIPISLEITIDGLAGFVIGEIFRVNHDSLPTEYKNKNIGFIVTKISHAVENGDWITVIGTQVCLLDQSSLLGKYNIDTDQYEKRVLHEAQKLSQENKDNNRFQIIYYNILIGFIHDFNNAIIYDNQKGTFVYGESGYSKNERFRDSIVNEISGRRPSTSSPSDITRTYSLDLLKNDLVQLKRLQQVILTSNYIVETGQNPLVYVLNQFFNSYYSNIKQQVIKETDVLNFKKSVFFIRNDIPVKMFYDNDSNPENYMSALDAIIRNSYFYTNLGNTMKTLFDEYYNLYSNNVKEGKDYTFYLLKNNDILYDSSGNLKNYQSIKNIIDEDISTPNNVSIPVNVNDINVSLVEGVVIPYRIPLINIYRGLLK